MIGCELKLCERRLAGNAKNMVNVPTGQQQEAKQECTAKMTTIADLFSGSPSAKPTPAEGVPGWQRI